MYTSDPEHLKPLMEGYIWSSGLSMKRRKKIIHCLCSAIEVSSCLRLSNLQFELRQKFLEIDFGRIWMNEF